MILHLPRNPIMEVPRELASGARPHRDCLGRISIFYQLRAQHAKEHADCHLAHSPSVGGDLGTVLTSRAVVASLPVSSRRLEGDLGHLWPQPTHKLSRDGAE